MHTGIAVSPGVAVGVAYCIDQVFVAPDARPLEDREIPRELRRYQRAQEKTSAELRAVREKVAAQVGREAAEIFRVQEMILQDPSLVDLVTNRITEQRLSASGALHSALEHFTAAFSQMKDEYLRNRLSDLRDVILRLSSHLTEVLDPSSNILKGPLIIVANELLPSHTVTLGALPVRGLVTQAGSATSHAAIVARIRGIPAVSGVRGILQKIQTGDSLIVDGRQGQVILRPDDETRKAYLKLERSFFDFRELLAENRDEPAATHCGESLELLANVNVPDDAKAARLVGGCGVGLYRTEYLYLMHPNVPDEEEQLAAYREMIRKAPGRDLTIRTLDIGGDKTIPYLGHDHQEANPFMGWRSIRLSFEHPELFKTQLRAILRAAAEAETVEKQIKLMFPMITALEEIERVRDIVEECKRQLESQGKPYSDVPLGMMLETPAAAVCLDVFMDSVDFVSIGSNDLVQYLMAADRDNPKVSGLCDPLSPPVLRILLQSIRCCQEARKPLTLCGEMAGQAEGFVLLLGMGLRSFSMSPAFIPYIKDLAAQITKQQAEQILQGAMRQKTAEAVRQHVAQRLKEIAPSAAA